jgi:dTDP-4-dehydrorhamnose 3,5-epimerase
VDVVSTRFEPLDLDGVVLVTPVVHGDDRGFFLERHVDASYLQHGIGPFVQDNHSRSARGVLRGIHWQLPPKAQGKLVSVVRGAVFDVAVDLRRASPTFGRWVGARLDDRDHRQLWVPPGFGHGFLVLSEVADVHYKSTERYAPELERGLRWDDPEVGIDWGIDVDEGGPTLSARDARLPRLAELDDADLFTGGTLEGGT